jgi:hypothetical protein
MEIGPGDGGCGYSHSTVLTAWSFSCQGGWRTQVRLGGPTLAMWRAVAKADWGQGWETLDRTWSPDSKQIQNLRGMLEEEPQWTPHSIPRPHPRDRDPADRAGRWGVGIKGYWLTIQTNLELQSSESCLLRRMSEFHPVDCNLKTWKGSLEIRSFVEGAGKKEFTIWSITGRNVSYVEMSQLAVLFRDSSPGWLVMDHTQALICPVFCNWLECPLIFLLPSPQPLCL